MDPAVERQEGLLNSKILSYGQSDRSTTRKLTRTLLLDLP